MKFFKKHKGTTLDHNLFINNLNGILQALSINLVMPFASLYTKRLNGTDNDIALLNAYPSIFAILSVFLGTYLFRKYKNKKKVTALFFGFGRSFFLLFVFIPFLPASIQASLFVLLYGAMSFPNSIANMGWQSYLADLFPEKWRGRAFSKRSTLSTLSALVVTLITGNLLYFIPKSDSQRIKLYQIFFIIAFVIAIFEVGSLIKHRLDKNSKQVETITEFENEPLLDKLKNIFRLVVKNRIFLDYCICVVIFHFAWQMGWPLFFSYEFDILHSNESWSSIIATVSCIAQAVTFPLWQKLSEKKGNSFAIFIAIFLMGVTPFLYLLSTSIIHVVFFNAITGSAVAGTTLLLLSNLYETAPNKDRTLYIAVYTVITNITLMFAPILGMKLKGLTNIYTALLVVGILRLLSSGSFYLRYLKYKKKSV
ncbi:transporter, major facilitator family protein [Clostridiales bacterium oral taxon 876 str. F0540]|nr:transporter, major facilitator family protein [Clostridiales bacterium oral taxon 876 str. F0540]